MFTSFSTALSALSAHSTAVDVVGNNLANLNTIGFKTSFVSFQDLVTQSLGAGMGETQVGFGVGRPITHRQFSQGAIQTSSGVLDAAIQGDGFFVLRDPRGNQLLTRAGNFHVDNAGRLLSSTGHRVQGWTEAGGVIDTNNPVGDITVPVGELRPPRATSKFSLNVNLDSSAADGATFSTPIETIDSLGNSHVLTVTFTKKSANTWDWDVTAPSGDLKTPGAGAATSLKTGTITFGADGKLATPDAAGGAIALSLKGLTSGAADMDVTWNLYGPDKVPLLGQFAEPSAVSANSQDGLRAAQLVRVGLTDGGRIMAQYSNGQQQLVGRLAMAGVRNPESLIATGESNFQLSAASALPAIGIPETGGRGKIIGSALEYSTVDIAREFTNLIVLQRGYQANARVVTAVDELSQDTINLKR